MYHGVPTGKEGVLAQRAVREFRGQAAPHCRLHAGLLGRPRMGHHWTRQCEFPFDVKLFMKKLVRVKDSGMASLHEDKSSLGFIKYVQQR